MKHINSFTKFNENNNNLHTDDNIASICGQYGIVNYTIGPDGTVDVDGDVNISFKELTQIPLTFGKVTGSFNCGKNKLTSLIGCPKEVGKSFSASTNQLTSLEGCPASVGTDFFCGDNKITSLKGCPSIVNGDFDCGSNQLVTLEFCPNTVKDTFNCSDNPLITLKWCPKGMRKIIYHATKLPFEFNNVDINYVIINQDNYGVWKQDGTLNKYRFQEMMSEKK